MRNHSEESRLSQKTPSAGSAKEQRTEEEG
jgi:hypothetical protein